MAALRFILSSGAKHDVDAESLSSELQQLGLPKEHATSLCKAYADSVAPVRQALHEKSLRRMCVLRHVHKDTKLELVLMYLHAIEFLFYFPF